MQKIPYFYYKTWDHQISLHSVIIFTYKHKCWTTPILFLSLKFILSIHLFSFSLTFTFTEARVLLPQNIDNFIRQKCHMHVKRIPMQWKHDKSLQSHGVVYILFPFYLTFNVFWWNERKFLSFLFKNKNKQSLFLLFEFE